MTTQYFDAVPFPAGEQLEQHLAALEADAKRDADGYAALMLGPSGWFVMTGWPDITNEGLRQLRAAPIFDTPGEALASWVAG